ncbi:hypothetical protein J690_1045 [Acinetobacter sp. 742879]|nr:hypothetical protein J690_1045 [Acinetobacter sp. 742879]
MEKWIKNEENNNHYQINKNNINFQTFNNKKFLTLIIKT